jgi:formylglycine-generating enzyme
MMITDAPGKQRGVAGIYAALSFNEGETWRRWSATGNGNHRPAHFTMSASSAETFGYMAITQGVSSENHYAFNLAWLRTPSPALP